MSNFLWAITQAAVNSQSTLGQQSIVDAQSTEAFASGLQDMYANWKKTLDADAAMVNMYAGQTDSASQSWENYFNVQFNRDNTAASAAENQVSGVVQSTQNQAQNDSSNNSNLLGMTNGIQAIGQTLSSLMAQGI